MAKSPVYLGDVDIKDLCTLVYNNNCTMLSKSDINNFAVAYNVCFSTVKKTIKRIIASSYKDKHGKWKLRVRYTMGAKILSPCVSRVKSEVYLAKTTGTKIDVNKISIDCSMTPSFITNIISDM